MGTDITVTAADGGTFAAYFALPAKTPAPGSVLLPEVFNTNDHIRAVVDGYAEDGFVVLAPDVYWREEAGNYLPYTDEGRAKAQSLRGQMDTDQFTTDLGDTIATLTAHEASTGKVGVMGFCLGGKFTYLSSVRHKISAAVSYYGVQIDEHLDEAENLNCPIVMHFAENDPHVPADTVAAIKTRMGDWNNVDVRIYPGTEHGFNRFGYEPYNEVQAAIARNRTIAHFRKHLGG